MGRNTNVSKSQGALAIKEKWPGAFCQARSDVDDDKPAVVVDDILQALNTVRGSYGNRRPQPVKVPKTGLPSAIGVAPVPLPGGKRKPDDAGLDEEKTVTLKDILRSVTWRYHHDPYKGARLYVFAMDKHDLVPAAKGDEQEKRRKGVKTPDQLTPIDFNNLEKPIADFSSHLQDRTGSRRKILRWLSLKLIDPESLAHIRPEDTCLFTLDGHCLTLQDMKELGIKGADKLKSDEEAYLTPVTLFTMKGRRQMQCEPNIANRIGEVDFLPYFYLNYITDCLSKNQGMWKLEIISNDTDSLYLSLLYLFNARRVVAEREEEEPKILIQKITAGKTEWISVNRLWEDMAAAMGSDRAVVDVLVAMISNGSDFTDSHYYVPHRRFLEAVTKYGRQIGPLFSCEPKPDDRDRQFFLKKEYFDEAWVLPDEIHLSRDGYISLLMHAYALAHQVHPKELRSISVTRHLHDEINAVLFGERKVDQKKFFPEPEDLRNGAKQVLYYLRMMFSVGLPNVKANNVLQYGYCLKDTTKGLIKGNVTKLRPAVDDQ